jgi:hypothetical protein
MGDRPDRKQGRDRAKRLQRYGSPLPPEPILTWGIGDLAQSSNQSTNALGHNGGPPLEDEQGYLWRKYRWTKAYKEAWKPPSMSVLKFRVARAEAAGLSYHDYMLELLDTGRHLQKADVDKRARAVAKPMPLGGPGSSQPTQPSAPQPTREASSKPSSKPAGRPVPQPLGGPKQK